MVETDERDAQVIHAEGGNEEVEVRRRRKRKLKDKRVDCVREDDFSKALSSPDVFSRKSKGSGVGRSAGDKLGKEAGGQSRSKGGARLNDMLLGGASFAPETKPSWNGNRASKSPIPTMSAREPSSGTKCKGI